MTRPIRYENDRSEWMRAHHYEDGIGYQYARISVDEFWYEKHDLHGEARDMVTIAPPFGDDRNAIRLRHNRMHAL